LLVLLRQRAHTRTMRTALITGASRGLGRALARELADRGWRLVIDARGVTELQAVTAELRNRTDVVAIAGDVSDEEHRTALIDAAAGAARAHRPRPAQWPVPSGRPALPGQGVGVNLVAERQRVDSLDFELPAALEATEPAEVRGRGRDDVRLLVARRRDLHLAHGRFWQLPEFLEPGDLVVVNTSATLPAAVSALRADRTAVEL